MNEKEEGKEGRMIMKEREEGRKKNQIDGEKRRIERRKEERNEGREERRKEKRKHGTWRAWIIWKDR